MKQAVAFQFFLIKSRFMEWMVFDSRVAKFLIASLAFTMGIVLLKLNRIAGAFRCLKNAHQVDGSRNISARTERVVRLNLPSTDEACPARFEAILIDHVANAHRGANAIIAKNPDRMLKGMAIVVASAFSGRARGVIILCYNYGFPLFAREYDIRRVLEKYHLVLEPSWSGFCTEDILSYCLWDPSSVFVQAYEPKDRQFIEGIGIGLKAVPLSANWWVDHRVFSPDKSVEKDLDFIMVASWANFKRHHRFFSALRMLRHRGHRLKGVCVGYPAGLTLADIKQRAEWYGVRDQITFYESISQLEIARLMNRAKVNAVWSRREGVNRVIIEGMFCNIPCLIPDGFNYGYRYPYINSETGRWSQDATLARDLLDMSRGAWHGAPSNWVRENMTPQHAARILHEAIGKHCEELGEPEPEPIVPKTNGLDGQEYWTPTDEVRFAADYSFLRSLLKG